MRRTGCRPPPSKFTATLQARASGAADCGGHDRDRTCHRDLMTSSTVNGAAAPEARLLVVDDEPNIVELLSASLRYAGFDVDIARSGTEALQLARRTRPDLLVLDVMMPGMDGFDVVRRLRAEGLRFPVLFLTARDSTEDKVSGLTLGGDDYVTKP